MARADSLRKSAAFHLRGLFGGLRGALGTVRKQHFLHFCFEARGDLRSGETSGSRSRVSALGVVTRTGVAQRSYEVVATCMSGMPSVARRELTVKGTTRVASGHAHGCSDGRGPYGTLCLRGAPQ